MTNYFLGAKEQMKHIDIVKNRTACINTVFNSIEEAKNTLKKLEEMAAQRADGRVLDIHEVGVTSHKLRGCVDRILVGLVESQTVSENQLRE